MTPLQWALWNTIYNGGRRNPWYRTMSERVRSASRRYKRYIYPKKEIIYWSTSER